MKILLIYTNKNRYLAPPPIGLAMIAESVAAAHTVEFLDFMFEAEPEAKALRTLQEFRPDLIGLSIRILDNQDSRDPQSPLEDLRRFIAQVRQVSSAPVVLGGPAFTTFPVEMLDFLGADYGIAGPGEKVFPQLAEQVGRGPLDESLPGLVFHKEGRVVANPPVMDGYPAAFVPKRCYYDYRRYARAAQFPGIVLSKTGCPFRCIYCDPQVTASNRFLLRSPEVIVSELKHQARQFNLRAIHLSDPCFNAPLDYAKAVVEAILRSGLRLALNTTIRPDFVDEELARMMKRAGFIFLVVGADTLSPAMLEWYQKGFTLDQVERCCRLLEKHGLAYMVECVFGGPGETTQTVAESLNFLNRIRPSLTHLGAGLRILPETDLYRLALAEGRVQGRAELLFPKFYFSPAVEKGWLYRRLETYNRQYGRRNARMARVVARKYARLWFGG
jgi:anaerobic magnesium-protoporphyrin IX monomethyl ester cyclase